MIILFEFVFEFCNIYEGWNILLDVSVRCLVSGLRSFKCGFKEKFGMFYDKYIVF